MPAPAEKGEEEAYEFPMCIGERELRLKVALCNNRFCRECIEAWAARSATEAACPYCNGTFSMIAGIVDI